MRKIAWENPKINNTWSLTEGATRYFTNKKI